MRTDNIKFKLTKAQIKLMAPLSKACYETKERCLIMGDVQILRNCIGKPEIIAVRFGLFSERVGRKIVKHSQGKQITFEV